MKQFYKNKLVTLSFVLICALFGGFLRFYGNTLNPVSLNIDEVSIGYNAYSILKTGRDEYGVWFPLSFRSVGDYKSPVLIYLTVPSIAIFGLNDFSVRFPVAFMSTISIILFYFFFKEFTGNRTISLISTVLIAISPWHIYFSRYAAESSMALSFLIAGVFCFFKMIKGKWIWSIFAALFLVLSMYTYHAERLFTPLLSVLLIVFNLKAILKDKKKIIIFAMLFLAASVPLFISIIFGSDKTRFQSTFITTDIVFYRQVLMKAEIENISLSEYPLLFFYWARKYLFYFDSKFLFYSGLNLTVPGTYGLGVVYLFELPLLILGIIYLVKNRMQNKYVLLLWVILGILPASLTNNEQHALRALLVLPMVIIVSGIGANYFIQGMNIKPSVFKRGLYLGYLLFLVWNLFYGLLIYTVHFPKQRDEDFMAGTKQTVEYALANKNKYKEIVFDPYRGIEAPYIVSIPHMYILFYSKYDPATYQKEEKIRPDGSFGFDKFTIRQIDWRVDRSKKDTLFIGSPWSLPEKDIKEEDILEKIYLGNGSLAFFIVSPKQN